MPRKLPSPNRVSVAPMMDWTDRHCRYFLRLITRHTLLYTEMVTTGALLHGDASRLLAYHPHEHPVALQLGGSEPGELAACARLAEAQGYDQVNLNVGCPSDRVQSGRFGACLMAEPQLVADCVAAMNAACAVPVTVKTRIGIDDRDAYEDLVSFVDTVRAAGCRTFIVHARKAWLQGLSPRENREIPPLRYDVVHRLKADFPDLEIILNGGLQDLDSAAEHLGRLDGVMFGREAYHNPYMLVQVDRRVFGDDHPVPTRHQVVADLLPYVSERLDEGVPLQAMTRHILGLFQGCPGARAWRRHLSENAHRTGAGIEVIRAAAARVPVPGDGETLSASA
ncbi:tRNA dihydrouridine(20/20a) synthase DusA [Thioalkalivibrio denitrificans]|uniref:tRNA-dihydrouridine(20/20a) synthase n=1 Tax=Thioalkalivibrio denitrificans TaxID=108003 RepID=A0A1V3NLI7_9GAMM|nr:tRNA dihydrouridine(20/20a) synthase DusA [Thioalkalivibrio denitrificans]OOG25925.1 tRNA dihydrouridine(20/20a) synthase DusA [Thioalkalivibrio denitrificans]